MKKDQSKYVWGGLLILAGVLFLLQEFNILGSAFEYLWVLLMAAGSAVFLWIYFTKQDQWWASHSRVDTLWPNPGCDR